MDSEKKPKTAFDWADILVKIFSGLLGVVFIVFMIMFWFK